MALQSSGAISLNQIHIEAGGSSGTTCSLNDSDIRALIDKSSGASNAFSEYYGASASTNLSGSAGSNINGQVQISNITVSNYISSGGTLEIPSGMYVWSNSTSTPAMTIDIPCTVINNGKIIGCGGKGGNVSYGFSGTAHVGGNGGVAINVTSSGVTITNGSGAYIAGGGGGGSTYPIFHTSGTFQQGGGGGGGGAGGGGGGSGGTRSGYGYSSSGNTAAGGVLNASGANGTLSHSNPVANAGSGGGAGGGAGGSGGDISHQGDGGAGGRILPGTGGSGGSASGSKAVAGTAGGSAGNAGVNNTTSNYSGEGAGFGAGGGGGWGANGGQGRVGLQAGGTGGAAITGTSRTLSNSGTIYGST